MATKISWADESWNPIIGCSKISEGCANCYAERQAYRLYRMGQVNYGHVTSFNKWSGDTFFVESALTKPLHWRTPRKIFVCSMSDLFHESVPFEWIDRVFAVMTLCPQHQFMCLTKRAGRMREYFAAVLTGKVYCENSDNEGNTATRIRHEAYKIVWARRQTDKPDYNMWNNVWPLSNVHLGVTVENQENVGRIADLIRTPAAKRFVSFEPLLEKVIWLDNPKCWDDSKKEMSFDYALIGCESGSKARLCELKDIRFMMMQCKQMGVKIHVKQLPLDGKCNKDINQWPEEFQIREI